MPYCFMGSSIKFQGHTGWKIDEFNPIWVRLLGLSQLSNPSDLPCYFLKMKNHSNGASNTVPTDDLVPWCAKSPVVSMVTTENIKIVVHGWGCFLMKWQMFPYLVWIPHMRLFNTLLFMTMHFGDSIGLAEIQDVIVFTSGGTGGCRYENLR